MPTTLPNPPVSLDFSLQMQVAAINMLDDGMKNPCAPPPGPAPLALKKMPKSVVAKDVQGYGRPRR